TPWFPNTIPGAWGRLSPLVPGVALPCGAQIRAGPPRRPALSHALRRAAPSTSTPGDALCPPDASQNCSRDIRRVTCAAWGKFTKTSQQINTETYNITLVRFDPCTPPVTVPPPDAFTQILFDFSHVASGTSTVYDLSPNHFIGTVAAGFSGATAPSFDVEAPPTLQTETQANNALTLTWSTVAGQIYQLQYKTNLPQPNWINWFYPLVATGGSITVSD